MKAMFVNDPGHTPYAFCIALGYKPVETRHRNMLAQLVGDRVAVVRTHRGKKPLVVGYVDVVRAAFMDSAWLDGNRDLTLIPPGSVYDSDGRGKWCYFLENAETCTPYPLPENAVRHGRSWCEF